MSRRSRKTGGTGLVVAVAFGAYLGLAHHGHGGDPFSAILDSVAAAPASTGHGNHAVLAYARAQVGCSYVWAGNGPCQAGYDCSGLATAAWAAAGVTIPRDTFHEWADLPHVPSPAPGDLVFFAGADGTTTNPGHVGIVIRPGLMIDAYDSAVGVAKQTYGTPGSDAGLQNPVGYAAPGGGG